MWGGYCTTRPLTECRLLNLGRQVGLIIAIHSCACSLPGWPTGGAKHPIKATYVTLVAVVGRLLLDSALVGDLLALSTQLVAQDLDALHGLQQAVPAEQRGEKNKN